MLPSTLVPFLFLPLGPFLGILSHSPGPFLLPALWTWAAAGVGSFEVEAREFEVAEADLWAPRLLPADAC